MGALEILAAAGLGAELEPSSTVRVRGKLTNSWRSWIRDRRDTLVAELRTADQDQSGLRDLLAEMVEDVAAVDRALADRLQEHIELLLQTAPETARAEVARCWACLIACRRPELPETTPWRWIRVRSRLLGQTFLLVEDEHDVEDARRAHPNLVVWMIAEALELIERPATDQTIRAVHRVKRTFGGRVLHGSDVPAIEPMELQSQPITSRTDTTKSSGASTSADPGGAA